MRDLAHSECAILIENTGHYSAALEQHLAQHGIVLHKIHVQHRATKRKSDKRDALHRAQKQTYSDLRRDLPRIH
jgi:transposase